jgi:hypothetical protein
LSTLSQTKGHTEDRAEIGKSSRSADSSDQVMGSLEKRLLSSPENASAEGWWLAKVTKSPLAIGVLLILLINGLLLCWQPFARVDPNMMPATHTWTWWAVQEYLGTKPTPPVVLIGSSLFMHSMSRQDADFLNQDLDYVRHHRSMYLESLLKKKYGAQTDAACFNFSLPGDLISDNYMIVRTILRGDHKPEYVVMGLSLRDFIDNAINCPGTTPPFRYLKRFTDISDIVGLALPQIWQQLDYRFGQVFYLWQRKLDLEVLAEEWAKTTFRPLAQKAGASSLLNNLDYRHHVPANLHSEVEEGMAIVKAHQPVTYDPNYADYKRRCGKANLPLFEIQAEFLKRTLQICKDRGIKVVILNMPVTPENLALMPPGSYERYLNTVKECAAAQGYPFEDLNLDTRFVHSDFYDTAHMNAAGGKKLAEAISEIHYLKLGK